MCDPQGCSLFLTGPRLHSRPLQAGVLMAATKVIQGMSGTKASPRLPSALRTESELLTLT